MKRNLGLRCCAVLMLLWSGSALSTPVIVGSDYNLTLFGAGGVSTFSNIVFDGAAQGGFTRNGVTVSVAESQTNLGGGLYRVAIAALGSGDLFQGTGGAGLNVGFALNPLELDAFYTLQSTVLRVYRGALLLEAREYLPLVLNPDPWDGFWTGPGGAGAGIPNAGNAGINLITLEMRLSRIPVPSTIALFAIGLAALGMRGSRRAS